MKSESKSYKKSRLKVWVIRPLIIALITIAVLFSAAFIILTTQQERLVSIALNELNQQIKGEITIEESKISLFKNFPYVSVALHEVRFFSDKTESKKAITMVERNLCRI